MRKRRKALLWTLTGLLFVLAVVLVSTQSPRRDNQPVYNGRTLTQWLDVGAHSPNRRVWGLRNDGRGPTPEQLNEAAQAVRAIGTNAIPFLLEWISYRANGPQRFFKGVLGFPLPGPVRDFLFMTVGGGKYEIRSDLGELGFALLHTNALPAREALSKLVRDANNAGEPWRDRLLPLPAFLREGARIETPPSADEIADGFRMTGFFLARDLFAARGAPLPDSRRAFLAAAAKAMNGV